MEWPKCNPGTPVLWVEVLRVQEPGMMWYCVVLWEILAYEKLSKVSHGPWQYCGREKGEFGCRNLGFKQRFLGNIESVKWLLWALILSSVQWQNLLHLNSTFAVPCNKDFWLLIEGLGIKGTSKVCVKVQKATSFSTLASQTLSLANVLFEFSSWEFLVWHFSNFLTKKSFFLPYLLTFPRKTFSQKGQFGKCWYRGTKLVTNHMCLSASFFTILTLKKHAGF